MFPRSAILMLLAGLSALGGCGRKPPAAPEKPRAAAEDAAYAVPPSVSEVRFGTAGVALSGGAPPGVQVRLGTPSGQALFARADAQGRWTLTLPPADEARIYGLSEKLQGRQVQGEGYLVVTPQGRAALLRAGAGSTRLDPLRSPSLGAIDFDQDGAVVVSGVAAPGAVVFLRLDGRQLAEVRADGGGRYTIVAPQPIARGVHAVEAAGDGFANAAQLAIAPPSPLAGGPLRSQVTQGGVRIDWLTPGGGVQSTLLLD